jgi:hypothetical protein
LSQRGGRRSPRRDPPASLREALRAWFSPTTPTRQTPPGSSPPSTSPCARRTLGVNLLFAGEPLAEIRGFTVKPFEPDAGNSAEGSEVVLRS